MEIKIPIVVDDKALQEAIDKRAAELKQEGDFVLITRCENCKFCFGDYCNHPKNTIAYNVPDFGKHCIYKDGIKVEPNHFCGYAEPKEIEGGSRG